MRNRPISILFRVNEMEHQHLKEQVRLSGLPMEQYLRRLIAGQTIKPRPPEEVTSILRQLSAIGNNINQIAKVANTYKRVSEEDIRSIQEMQQLLWQKVKQL